MTIGGVAFCDTPPQKNQSMKKKEGVFMIPDIVIVNKIFELRNKKVMLDRDLAELYGVEPRRLREQVKRNFSRFPDHFMFQLTEVEVEIMVS